MSVSKRDPDWYLSPGWMDLTRDRDGTVTSLGWRPPALGPRRPVWPSACPHERIDASCTDCYLSVTGLATQMNRTEAEDRAYAALEVIDRYEPADPRVRVAFNVLAASMDEIFGPPRPYPRLKEVE